jgi:hypothetical protein
VSEPPIFVFYSSKKLKPGFGLFQKFKSEITKTNKNKNCVVTGFFVSLDVCLFYLVTGFVSVSTTTTTITHRSLNSSSSSSKNQRVGSSMGDESPVPSTKIKRK